MTTVSASFRVKLRTRTRHLRQADSCKTYNDPRDFWIGDRDWTRTVGRLGGNQSPIGPLDHLMDDESQDVERWPHRNRVGRDTRVEVADN
jgi:hypothetical protein